MPLPTTANTTSHIPGGYDALLGDLYVRLALGPGRQFGVESGPLQPPQIGTEQTAEEFSDDFGKVFARSDFTGGSGLDRAHRAGLGERDATRFWDSRGLDVSLPAPGRAASVRLSREFSRILASAATTQRMAYSTAAGKLYVTAGTTLQVSTTPTADLYSVSPPVFAAESPHAGEAATNVTGITVDGTDVYAALNGNGIHRYTGGAWGHYNALTASNVWWAADRLIATETVNLYEVTASGAAPSPLYSLGPGLTWEAVVDAGSHLLAAASNGTVYAFTPDETGVLTLVAQSEVFGQPVVAMASFAEFVFVATAVESEAGGTICRWYRFVLGEDGVLRGGQLLRKWGDETTSFVSHPRIMLCDGEAVWLPVRESLEGATAGTIWRYDLVTAGVSRHFDAVSGTTSVAVADGLVSINGQLLITHPSAAAGGVFAEHATRYPAGGGWLITPLADFFTAEEKNWVSARIDGSMNTDLTQDQPAGAKLYYSTDPDALLDPNHASWELVINIGGLAGTWPGVVSVINADVALSEVTSRYIAAKIELTPGSPGVDLDTAWIETPEIRSVGFRAYPTADEWIINLPVNVSDQIERRNRRRIHIKGYGDQVLADLLDKVGTSIELQLFRPYAATYQGTIEHVAAPVNALGERGSHTTYSLVRFRGKKVEV